MIYLDTSAAIPMFVRETDSDRLIGWLDRGDADSGLAISGWVTAEISSALAAKIRNKDIEAGWRDLVLARMQAFFNTATVFEIVARDFIDAARLCDRHEGGLRAGDALHLAVVLRHGARLCTLDIRFADAARSMGVEVVLP